MYISEKYHSLLLLLHFFLTKLHGYILSRHSFLCKRFERFSSGGFRRPVFIGWFSIDRFFFVDPGRACKQYFHVHP